MTIVLVVILAQMDQFEAKLRRSRGSQQCNTMSINMKYRRRIVKILFTYLLISMICWTPLQFIVIYRHFRSEAVLAHWFFELAFFAQLSASLSSAMNPIIFGFLSQPFRQIVAKLWIFRLFEKMFPTNTKSTNDRNNDNYAMKHRHANNHNHNCNNNYHKTTSHQKTSRDQDQLKLTIESIEQQNNQTSRRGISTGKLTNGSNPYNQVFSNRKTVNQQSKLGGQLGHGSSSFKQNGQASLGTTYNNNNNHHHHQKRVSFKTSAPTLVRINGTRHHGQQAMSGRENVAYDVTGDDERFQNNNHRTNSISHLNVNHNDYRHQKESHTKVNDVEGIGTTSFISVNNKQN